MVKERKNIRNRIVNDKSLLGFKSLFIYIIYILDFFKWVYIKDCFSLLMEELIDW